MTRFVRNRAFEREMKADPEFIEQTHRTTEDVGDEVKKAAEPFRNTGYFIRRIEAKDNLVGTSDFAWHWIEFGSVNNPPYAPFRRGVRAAGLRFDDPAAH